MWLYINGQRPPNSAEGGIEQIELTWSLNQQQLLRRLLGMATAPAALSAATIAGDAAAASLPATIVYVTVSGDAAADMPQAPPPPPNPPPPSPTPRRPQRSPETVVIANLAFAVSPPLHPQCSSYYRRTAAHNATPRLVEPPHSPTMQLLVSSNRHIRLKLIMFPQCTRVCYRLCVSRINSLTSGKIVLSIILDFVSF